jgi:hypothetical protein
MKRHGSLSMLFVLSLLFVTGCSSGNKKSEARDKVTSQSGLYCDFVNGEKNRQIELELNILMAKKCDVDKPYTISDYRSPAEVSGMIFCCRVKEMQTAKAVAAPASAVKAPVSAPASPAIVPASKPATAPPSNSNGPSVTAPAKSPADSNIKVDDEIDFGSN